MEASKLHRYHVHFHSQYIHMRIHRAYKLVQMWIHARVNVHNTWYYCTSAVQRDCASVCLATTVNFVGILSIFERVYGVYRPTLNDWPIREVKHWLCRGCPYSCSCHLLSLSLSRWHYVQKWSHSSYYAFTTIIINIKWYSR